MKVKNIEIDWNTNMYVVIAKRSKEKGHIIQTVQIWIKNYSIIMELRYI